MSGNKQQRLTGWEVMGDELGNVYTSGVPSDPVGRHRPIDLVERSPLEAVVEAIHYPDEDDRNAVTQSDQRAVLVDVRTLGHFSRQARWIPVLQRAQGLWDEDIYIPRPTRQNIDGGDLSTGSAAKGDTAPTPAESMDGDRGLLFFLESNPAKPVFLPYSLGHPRTNNPRTAADGRVRRIRHAGVLMEWSPDGNWTLDATEAAKQDLGSRGAEEANNGTAGVVTIKTKDGAGAELHLILDEAGNVVLQGGGGTEKLTLTKAALAELVAGTSTLTLTSAGTATLNAPASIVGTSAAITLTGTASIAAVAPSIALTGAATITAAAPAITLTSPALVLGVASPDQAATLVKHTGTGGWSPSWVTALAEFTAQVATYTAVPAVVSPADYLRLVQQLQALATAFATATTAVTRGG